MNVFGIANFFCCFPSQYVIGVFILLLLLRSLTNKKGANTPEGISLCRGVLAPLIVFGVRAGYIRQGFFICDANMY